MRSFIYTSLAGLALLLAACDKVEKPYPSVGDPSDLDESLYPGDWDVYVSTEWPTFTANTNTNRNVLIEDFTGHKCTFCPAAAAIAEDLVHDNPGRVFVAGIHSGPSGVEGFQAVAPSGPYTTDFTNPNGLEIGTFFGSNDPGFTGNPRGPVSRITSGGSIFQSPNNWTNLTNGLLTANDLKVNLQAELNYYATTRGLFVHVEADPIAGSGEELAVVTYLLEDSLVAPQTMGDNSTNMTYVHRHIMRGCIDGRAFGRTLTAADLNTNGNYYLNYSYRLPDQFNAENMHILIYVYNKASMEIYQVISEEIPT